jgi:hypothetical protein
MVWCTQKVDLPLVGSLPDHHSHVRNDCLNVAGVEAPVLVFLASLSLHSLGTHVAPIRGILVALESSGISLLSAAFRSEMGNASSANRKWL